MLLRVLTNKLSFNALNLQSRVCYLRTSSKISNNKDGKDVNKPNNPEKGSSSSSSDSSGSSSSSSDDEAPNTKPKPTEPPKPAVKKIKMPLFQVQLNKATTQSKWGSVAATKIDFGKKKPAAPSNVQSSDGIDVTKPLGTKKLQEIKKQEIEKEEVKVDAKKQLEEQADILSKLLKMPTVREDLLKPLEQKEKPKEEPKRKFENLTIERDNLIFDSLANMKVVESAPLPKTTRRASATQRPDARDKVEQREKISREPDLWNFEKREEIPEEFEHRRQESVNKRYKELPFDLYDAQPLNIFTTPEFKPLDVQPHESQAWIAHYEESLKKHSAVPPLNAFEEEINLTNEGKLWLFPIDNEQGIQDEDYDMPFYEHVLLDHYLDEFPQIEPIQNFMQLVLNGISKNAFLTVKEKKEIIYWYKDFFSDKCDLIKEAMRIEAMA